MSEYFKWKLLILDDHPEHYVGAISKLQEAGLSVAMFTTFSSIIESSVGEDQMENLIGNSHIALIDMQWDAKAIGNIGDESIYLPTESILKLSSDYSVLRRQWLQAVRKWIVSRPERVRSKWPRQRIEEEHVGTWIGALLSWIAPNTQLLFFSGFEKIFETGIQAALSQFRHPLFSVIPKTQDPATGEVCLEVDDLKVGLTTQQKELLLDRDIFEWFFSSVLLPVLAGEEPEERECSVFYWGSRAPERRMLRFDYFFPNLQGVDRSELWKHLRGYLSHPMLSESDIVHIKLVSHVLKNREAITLDHLRRARHYAILAHIWGEELVRIIDLRMMHAKSRGETTIDSADETLKQVLALCDVFSGHAATALQKLSNSEMWVVDLIRGRRHSGRSAHANVGFPWCPIAWVGEMLDHLVANADRHQVSWSASMTNESNYLRFRFSSFWTDELDVRGFWQCVRESAKHRGLDRGLPLVVRRALESGADACLLRAGAYETWLYGRVDDNYCGSDFSAVQDRFEIYLFFRMEDLP